MIVSYFSSFFCDAEALRRKDAVHLSIDTPSGLEIRIIEVLTDMIVEYIRCKVKTICICDGI